MSQSKNQKNADRDAEDLLKARAEARGILQAPDRPRHIVVRFVEPRFDEKSQTMRPRDCDIRKVDVNGKQYVRAEDESLEEFQQRVTNDLPALGPPQIVVMFPHDDGSEAA